MYKIYGIKYKMKTVFWLFIMVLVIQKLATSNGSSVSNFQDHSVEYQKKLFLPCPKNEEVFGLNLLEPSLFISMFVRNKEHSLPYFLNCLYNLKHSRSRISLW